MTRRSYATAHQVARVTKLFKERMGEASLPVPSASSGPSRDRSVIPDEGKRVYSTYDQAEAAAKDMRAKLNRNFTPYKTSDGWAVGGVHVKAKQPYKRIKTFSDLRTLFEDVAEPVEEAQIAQYAELIQCEANADKESTLDGESEGWILKSHALKSGYELGMSNNRQYLVLHLSNGSSNLELWMGGAFSPSIPLISRQAESLIGKQIVWHTWNSRKAPDQWSRSKWFYMIEEA